MSQNSLFGKTLKELTEIVETLSLPSYTANQLADWMYKKKVRRIEDMTNISKASRSKLSENYTINLFPPVNVQISADGTKKYLFNSAGNRFIEAAYIPEKNRNTLCVSSQVGCKMGCLFCMTGKQGFQGHLSSGEILNQIFSITERDKISNLVYMGMGEPLDNLDEVLKSLEILTSEYGMGMGPGRITVSTIGLIPAMKTFLEKSNCHLAVSLHNPFDSERKQLMPIETVYPVKEVVDTLKKFELNKQRRISFEYIMFKDFNDSSRHVNELARLLNGLKCRINLIRFHEIPGTPLKSANEQTIIEFKNKLNKKDIQTTIRASRGQDILAACGLLSTKELVKKAGVTG